jgi:UDP-N-acetylmuramoyl-tripeptide--D-alanyl-D-alanine ligase
VNLTLLEMQKATGGIIHKHAPTGQFHFDTRLLKEGQWFLALVGVRDGHDYIPIAGEKGCAGVISQRVPANWSKGFLEVENTLIAFQKIATELRRKFTGPVVGITGSAGKTTMRALIGCILESLGPVHQTEGNFNNHIGVPKTITDAPNNSVSWVIEMGMNALGEIHELQNISTPNIRLITNIGAAHVEGCGSIEGVAKAKGELFAGAKPGDICCINMDDHRVANISIPSHASIIRYGTSDECDIRLIENHVDGEQLRTYVTIQTPKGNLTSFVPIPGEFMALNACAAVAVAYALDIPISKISKQLKKYQPVGDRMNFVRRGSVQFINDSYNANILSMSAALRSLSKMNFKHKIALLGDMLEMGKEEHSAHIDVLRLAISLKLKIGIVGPRFEAAYQSLNSQEQQSIYWKSNTSNEMLKQIAKLPKGPKAILLKGSRGMKMEILLNNYPEESHE